MMRIPSPVVASWSKNRRVVSKVTLIVKLPTPATAGTATFPLPTRRLSTILMLTGAVVLALLLGVGLRVLFGRTPPPQPVVERNRRNAGSPEEYESLRAEARGLADFVETEDRAYAERVALEKQRELILSKPETTIGRAEQCDLGLFDDAGIDPVHARIERRGESYFLADAGSAGGTFLNNRRVTQPTRLHTGDLIRIGSSVLMFGERVFPEASGNEKKNAT